MTTVKTSKRYPLPGMEPPLAVAYEYWNSLKRGGYANMPFWDDLKLPDLGAARANAVLFDVMDGRFRFAQVGDAVAGAAGKELAGRFLDEVAGKGALAGLAEQATATVAESAPTYTKSDGFARLLLPMWGNGTIQMLLGAIAKG